MFESLKGTFRVGSTNVAEIALAKVKGKDLTLEETPKPAPPPLLEEAKKLIPGEALALYVSLQAFEKLAQNASLIRTVIAWVCLVVTFGLRVIGSQTPDDQAGTDGKGGVQWWVVLFSTVQFILLVYATNGQFTNHTVTSDMRLIAQILSAALGVIGVPLLAKLYKK